MVGVGFLPPVFFKKIFDQLLREHVALAALAVRTRIEVRAEEWINEQLETDGGAAAVARHQAYRRGQRASGAVSTDRNAPGIATEARRIFGGPARCSVSVFVGSREFVFRREAVFYREHDGTGAVGEGAAGGLPRVKRAQHHSASVKIHEHGKRRGPRRRIN